MKVFVTGATGFIGSAIVRELLATGHQVVGLARSDRGAAALTAAGAAVHRGALDDLDSLRAGVAGADGVIHTAFNNAGIATDFAAAIQLERGAVATLGEALVGSGRPFVVTSGTALLAPGRLATEESTPDPEWFGAIRGAMEGTVLALAARGVRVAVVRNPPSVHDGTADKHGFIPTLIGIARAKGVAGYVGDGSNVWAAVHRRDSAHLYRLALEAAPAGARLHAVGEAGVALRAIAGVIGRQLHLPVVSVPAADAGAHFGWFAPFAALDNPASSARTQQQLDWQPVQPGLLADLEAGPYFANGM